jgi:hypothetical protein
MRVITIALALAATGSAATAGHRACHEASSVVGYEECTRFGVGWSGRSLSWELGGAIVQLPFDAIDRALATSPNTHAVAPSRTGRAHVVRLRSVYGLTEHFYVASELELGALTVMPAIVLDPVARDEVSSASDESGWLISGMLAAGLRTVTGPIRFGGELAFGPRLAVFSTERAPDVLFGQSAVALEARVHASVWLSPRWSAGVMLGTSVFERADTSITFGLGLHAFPYDGGR